MLRLKLERARSCRFQQLRHPVLHHREVFSCHWRAQDLHIAVYWDGFRALSHTVLANDLPRAGVRVDIHRHASSMRWSRFTKRSFLNHTSAPRIYFSAAIAPRNRIK
jgi:hypothetical protein